MGQIASAISCLTEPSAAVDHLDALRYQPIRTAGYDGTGTRMVQVLFAGELFADYHQVCLHDEDHPKLPDDYTDETIARRLMAGPYGAIVHTARNMTVPVRVEWHRARADPDLAASQHIAEADFACPSGRLVLAGLTDYAPTAPRLAVRAGPLGVRACFAGLDTLDATGLDGDDRYLVQLWPADAPAGSGMRVLKAWPP